MQIETKFFGVKEIEESEIIHFHQGIPGFENYHRYVIIKYKEESQFFILQALDRADLALIIIELAVVVPGYSIDLSNEVVAELKLVNPENAVAVAVVVLPGDISKATVNLAAPIVINQEAHLAKQIILDHPDYGLRHPLFMKERETAIK